MSAATLTTPAVRTHAITAARTTTPRVIRSEWIKMRTLRSTWLTIGGILFALVAFGLISALTASGQVEVTAGEGGPPAFGGTDPVSTVLSGANFAVLIVAVLGAIVGAREYSTGMIRTTLAAVPKRLPVLWGKLVTFVGVLAPVALVGVLVSFFAGMAILDAGGAATVSWSDDGVARAVIGTAVYLVGLGVIGVALGSPAAQHRRRHRHGHRRSPLRADPGLRTAARQLGRRPEVPALQRRAGLHLAESRATPSSTPVPAWRSSPAGWCWPSSAPPSP